MPVAEQATSEDSHSDAAAIASVSGAAIAVVIHLAAGGTVRDPSLANHSVAFAALGIASQVAY
jgi:hypothetical protein